MIRLISLFHIGWMDENQVKLRNRRVQTPTPIYSWTRSVVDTLIHSVIDDIPVSDCELFKDSG